jgi:hypothetical protein
VNNVNKIKKSGLGGEIGQARRTLLRSIECSLRITVPSLSRFHRLKAIGTYADSWTWLEWNGKWVMALMGSSEERRDSFESLLSSFDSIVCRLVGL